MANAPVFGGRGFHKPPVASSADYKRIRDLPARAENDYAPDLIAQVTKALRTAGGTQTLRAVQAKALYDLATHRRLFAPMKVGSGKTLVTFLGPRVVNAKRPLLLTKASLIEKTEHEWRIAAKDWNIATHLKFMSYELLGRVSGANKLDVMLPDMILADEAHMLKNPRAAVTRRVARYMEAHPETIFVPLSGTIMKDSIKNFAHLMEWSHGQNACVPLYAATLQEWCEALDEGKGANAFTRRDPGVLLELYPGAYDDNGAFGDDNNRRARRVFQLRAKATPGVVVADAVDDYAGSLEIDALEYDVNAATEANFKTLRTTMCRPDGWALSEAVQVWAVARQLALGLHYEWDPKPPEEWLDARKQWAAFVRDFLATPWASRNGYDSELQVANGVLHGEVEDEYGLLNAWRAIKPTFEVNPKDVWHDDSALRVCAAWLKAHPKGIVWTEHQFFARELSRQTGVPYFGARGLDAKGNFIQDASGPVIASIAANSTGRNLQEKWNENLVTAPPTDSERWEQMIARTHRPGQVEDSVLVEVLVGCKEHLDSIPRALRSSQVKADMLGFEQKLKLADITWPPETGRSGPRWH